MYSFYQNEGFFGKTEDYGFFKCEEREDTKFWQSDEEMKTEDFPKFSTCEETEK